MGSAIGCRDSSNPGSQFTKGIDMAPWIASIVLLFQPGPSEESNNQLMGEIDAVLIVSP
jgi:hypothetical protein